MTFTEIFKPYIDVILTERSWSWTIVAIVYLITAYVIRSWFMKPLVFKAKELDRPIWNDIKSNYWGHCVLGWIFFLIPLLVLILIWYQEKLFVFVLKSPLILLLLIACFIVSVMMHLVAFGIALIETLKQIIKKDSDRPL